MKMKCRRILACLAALAALSAISDAQAVPSFARQMGVECNACHTQFPELNAFGRQFKLMGYTLSAGPESGPKTDDQKASLSLGRVPPVALMLQSAYTRTNDAVPEAQNNDVQLPQQLSLFLAGKISPKIGSFVQMTYSQADEKFGMDNAEFRFADSATVAGKTLSYGVTLNNAPGIEDLWSTTPVWRFPWTGPDVAPESAAATLIDGRLSQDVVGVGAFAFWDSRIYAATTLYRSAHSGEDAPGPASRDTIDSVAPYWRIAWQRASGASNLEIGGYGLSAKLRPEGVTGSTDDYRDVALDFQYDTTLKGRRIGLHGTLIDERRDLHARFDAGDAENESSRLATLRLDGSYYRSKWRYTLGYFSTSGDSDTGLYAPAEVDGSANGSPDSEGYILQASHSPWQNVQLTLQYLGYSKFNGRKRNYDGFGRDAVDNNTLFLQVWFNW